jgi:hypothetical protein
MNFPPHISSSSEPISTRSKPGTQKKYTTSQTVAALDSNNKFLPARLIYNSLVAKEKHRKKIPAKVNIEKGEREKGHKKKKKPPWPWNATMHRARGKVAVQYSHALLRKRSMVCTFTGNPKKAKRKGKWYQQNALLCF